MESHHFECCLESSVARSGRTGNVVSTPAEGVTGIVNLLSTLQGEGSDSLNVDDTDELLVNHQLTDNELIHLVSEAHPTDT